MSTVLLVLIGWIALSIPVSLLAAAVLATATATEEDIRSRLERQWQREVRRDIARADREALGRRI